MYELLYFSGDKGAPLIPSENYPDVLLTVGGEPVKLLKDVREVFGELYMDPRWSNTLIGISSRTDQPDWARELFNKFEVTEARINAGQENCSQGSPDGKETYFSLAEVFKGGPIEIEKDSKVNHFHRIASSTNKAYLDILFFHNEYENCASVADLGVTVGYCPDAVSSEIWQRALQAFPAPSGKVVEL